MKHPENMAEQILKTENIEFRGLAALPYHRIDSIISWGVDYTKSPNFRLRLNVFSYQEKKVAPKMMILQNSLSK